MENTLFPISPEAGGDATGSGDAHVRPKAGLKPRFGGQGASVAEVGIRLTGRGLRGGLRTSGLLRRSGFGRTVLCASAPTGGDARFREE